MPSIFPSFRGPSQGVARRDQGTFWLLHGFDQPRRMDLPLGPITGVTREKVDAQGQQVPIDPARDPDWYDARKPWMGNLPVGKRQSGDLLLWVLGYEDPERDLEVQPSGLGERARISNDAVREGTAALNLLTRVWVRALQACGEDLQAPRLPAAPPTHWFLRKSEARAEADKFRRECLEAVAFFLYAVDQRWDENDDETFNNFDETEAIVAIRQNSTPRGYCFDPLTPNRPDQQLIFQWMRRGIPFGYVWSARHELREDIRFFSPWREDAVLEISNEEESGEHVDVFAYSFGDIIGFPVSRWDAHALRTIYAYERYENLRYKIDVRVFYRDAQLPGGFVRMMEQAWTDRGERMGGAAHDWLNVGVHYFEDAIPHRVGRSLQEKMEYFRTTFANGNGLYLTHPPPEYEPSASTNLNGRRANWLWEIKEECRDKEWYNIGRRDPDVLGNTAVGCSESFCKASRFTFPEATELKLAHFMMEISEACRSELLALCIRNGMPIRPQFTIKYGRRLQDRAREEIRYTDVEGEALPAWRRSANVLGPSFPHYYMPGRNYSSYLDAVDRVASYPQIQRVLFYGGLTWRLAIEFVGARLAEEVGTGPSKAWKLVGGGPPPNLRDGLDTELYEPASEDELVRILHGTFPDGSSLWPPQEVFMHSWRWRGEWSIEDEAWFQTRASELRRGYDTTRMFNQWGKVIQKAPPSMRLSGRDEPIDEQVRDTLRNLRETDLLNDTLMRLEGRIEWDDDEEEEE